MDTYSIIRYYSDSKHPDHKKVIDTGLTLDEAQKHCNDPLTHEKGVWFDGYVPHNGKVSRSIYNIPASTLCALCKTKGDILHRVNTYSPE